MSPSLLRRIDNGDFLGANANEQSMIILLTLFEKDRERERKWLRFSDRNLSIGVNHSVQGMSIAVIYSSALKLTSITVPKI